MSQCLAKGVYSRTGMFVRTCFFFKGPNLLKPRTEPCRTGSAVQVHGSAPNVLSGSGPVRGSLSEVGEPN